jgi:hypothetical protein
MNHLRYIKIALLLLAGLSVSCRESNLTETNLGGTASTNASLFSTDIESEIKSFPLEKLSNEEIEGLYFLREEEKLARDVYRKFYEIYGLRIFNNIADSEQRHTDAVKSLIVKYDLADPVAEDIPGTFKNEELQNLYYSLIETGSESLIEALKVGVSIEEIDISDLQNQLDNIVDNQDIIFVYSSLKRGSENHLQAFNKNLSRRG